MSMLIDAGVIEDVIHDLEKRRDDIAHWGGLAPDEVSLRAGLVLAELRAALQRGKEEFVPLPEAAKKADYHPQTLRDYALKRWRGEAVPEPWSGLEVRREGRGYLVRVSSIPPNTRAA